MSKAKQTQSDREESDTTQLFVIENRRSNLVPSRAAEQAAAKITAGQRPGVQGPGSHMVNGRRQLVTGQKPPSRRAGLQDFRQKSWSNSDIKHRFDQISAYGEITT
jgi:hypothetical protein